MLKDKNILITGAASGIGTGFVKSFLKRGARLILCDINQSGLAKVRENVGLSNEHLIFPLDLTIESERLKLYEELASKGIEIDVLVNNAGIGYRSYLTDTPWDQLQKIINLNVVATSHLTWLFLPAMKRKNQGGVINLASTGSFCGADTASLYTGTKAFVTNFTEGLSMELMDTNVIALAAHPGATDTNFWDASGWANSSYNKTISMMKPEDTAEEFVCAFEVGKAFVIAGLKNKLMVSVSKFVPRGLLKRMAVQKYK